MQGRKKNLSLCGYRIAKKNKDKGKQNQRPFQQLWSVSQSTHNLNYNAFTDEHTKCYFISETLQKHCRNLSQCVKKEKKSSSIVAIGANLKKKKKQVNLILKKYQNSEDRKIYIAPNDEQKITPYRIHLKKSSKSKLNHLKQNLNQTLCQKQKQHKNFMKQKFNTKQPEKPQIKIIRTLGPFESDFVKGPNNRMYQRNYISGFDGFASQKQNRKRNSCSVNVNFNNIQTDRNFC